MSHLLVWVLACAGAIVAIVQLFTAKRLDLRPLIVGILTMLVFLGLVGIGWNASRALHILARPPPVDATNLLIARISAGVNGTVDLGIAVLIVSGLGGLGMFVRDLRAGSPEAEGTS